MKPIPTVTVRRGDLDVRINASDYDAERDGPLVEGEVPAQPVTLPGTNEAGASIGAVTAPPDAPVQPAEASGGTVPPAQSPEAVSDGPKPAAVVKKGRKWIVTDATGTPVVRDGIEADGYSSEKDAWDAIMKAGA